MTIPLTVLCFFFQAEDGIRYVAVTGVQTCALPILPVRPLPLRPRRRARALVQVGPRLRGPPRGVGQGAGGRVQQPPLPPAERRVCTRLPLRRDGPAGACRAARGPHRGERTPAPPLVAELRVPAAALERIRGRACRSLHPARTL